MNRESTPPWIRRAAILADFSERTCIAVSGADRAAFLHNFCTNDVNRLQPGEGCEAFFCDARGRIVGFANLFVRPDEILIDSSPGQSERLIAHLDRYVIREDVQLTDRSSFWRTWLLAGPTAEKSLASGLGGESSSSGTSAPSNEWLAPIVQLPAGLRSSAAGTIAGVPVVAAQCGYTGDDAWLLYVPAEESNAVAAALAKSEAVHRIGSASTDPAPANDEIEAARIEAGFPLYGVDITTDNLPQEVGRDASAISFRKGCYLGQETVARIDALGHVNRWLVGVQFAGDVVPRRGLELSAADRAGEIVGRVTSAAYSSRLNSPLALAYVRRESAKPGARLSSEQGDAQVVRLPIAD